MVVLHTIGRVALVATFIVSGVLIFMDIPGTSEMIANKVLPLPEQLTEPVKSLENALGLPIARQIAIAGAAIEIICALLIAVGTLTRWAALLLVLFLAVTTFYLHDFWRMEGADRVVNMTIALYKLSIVGGLLILMASPYLLIVREPRADEF
jgi:putative oxidoreductase